MIAPSKEGLFTPLSTRLEGLKPEIAALYLDEMAKAKQTVYDIEINYDWCKGCELCIEFCPFEVLEADEEGKPRVVRLEACTGCQLCELHCPDLAILVREL